MVLAIGIVVARGEEHRPGAIGVFGDHRPAKAQAHLGQAGFPQRLGLQRVGDVERVVALAPLVEAADKDGLPGAAVVDIGHDGRAIDKVAVGTVVVHTGQARHLGHHGGGHKGPGFARGHGYRSAANGFCLAQIGFGMEGMQHAVIAAHIHHGPAVLLAQAVGGIAGIAVAARGLAHVQGLRANDVAQAAFTRAVKLAHIAQRKVFQAAVTAQVVHQVGALGGLLLRIVHLRVLGQAGADGGRFEMAAQAAQVGVGKFGQPAPVHKKNASVVGGQVAPVQRILGRPAFDLRAFAGAQANLESLQIA